MKKLTVSIAAEEVEIDIIRSSRRTVALYVRPGGTLLVRAPWYVSVSSIKQFVQRKETWIERQRTRLKDITPPSEPLPVHDGSVIPFLGSQITVSINTGVRNNVVMTDGRLIITLSGKVTQQKAGLMVESWYLSEARSYFVKRTSELNKQYSYIIPEATAVHVRKMKRRWGSCNSNGSIWFNRELIKKDSCLIDYVIIHELCHLVHHNHSKEYYELLGSIVPDYRELRKRLQT